MRTIIERTRRRFLIGICLCLIGSDLIAAPQRSQWPISIEIPAWQLHDVRTTLNLSVSNSGAIVGHSPKAAPRILGPWRYWLARMWGLPLQRGAWLHLKAQRQKNGRVSGVLSSAFSPPLIVDCASEQAPMHCELRRQDQQFGTLHVHREGNILVPSELAKHIRHALVQHHYRPDNLRSERWQRSFKRMDRLLARARDDLDVLAAWRQLGRLPDSHISLLRGMSEDQAPAEAVGTAQKYIQLRWDQRIPVLQITSFALDPVQASERLKALFRELDQRGAKALIVDLRGNSGGNLSAMSLAAHLFDEPQLAGCFLTRTWWSEHKQPPSAMQANTLPRLERADLAEFNRAMDEHAAGCVRVTPHAPHFAGVVQVLIDGRSASAVEPLAYLLKSRGRARLIGAPTAGAMLSSEVVSIGDGWQLRLPTADYYAIDGQRLEGLGVSPEITVPANRALEYALR